jgi:PadR family transcriptional regulator PadR
LTLSSTWPYLHAVPTSHDPQLLKGVLSLLLLRLLAEQESYGYEVVKRLHELGLTDVLEGTVYPALARLEREQHITSRLVPSNAGPARKYYRPTTAGYAALADGTAQWHALVATVDRQLTGPVPAAPRKGNPS